jgi:hypothetical protein
MNSGRRNCIGVAEEVPILRIQKLAQGRRLVELLVKRPDKVWESGRRPQAGHIEALQRDSVVQEKKRHLDNEDPVFTQPRHYLNLDSPKF